jgi:hypothetical protein
MINVFELGFTGGAISFMIDITRIAAYIEGGIRPAPAILSGLLIFIPASLFGVMVGKRWVEKNTPGKVQGRGGGFHISIRPEAGVISLA